jgi:hypothetical protein
MKRLLIVAVALLGRPLHLIALSLVIVVGLFAGLRMAKGQPRTPSYSLPPDIGTQWQPGLTYNGGFPTGWPVTNVPCNNNPNTDLTDIQSALGTAPQR